MSLSDSVFVFLLLSFDRHPQNLLRVLDIDHLVVDFRQDKLCNIFVLLQVLANFLFDSFVQRIVLQVNLCERAVALQSRDKSLFTVLVGQVALAVVEVELINGEALLNGLHEHDGAFVANPGLADIERLQRG